MLKGARVSLRAIEKGDLERLCAFRNDVEMELAGGGDPPYPIPFAKQEAEYEEYIKGSHRDMVWWAIEVEGKMIGQCALYQFDSMAHSCGLGIGIGDKSYWGQGLGRETMEILLDWAFRHRNLRKVWLTTASRNERAYKCYIACGLVEEGRLRQHTWYQGGYDDLIHMGILREEWEAKAV